MLQHELKLRVRYAETDRMGYAYYGNYATYFEVARVEMLRELGFSYRILEDEGVLLPVLDYGIKYIRPAYYDDELRIVTTVNELPNTRIKFDYEIFNSNNEKLTIANTTLVFVNKDSGRPRLCPDDLLLKMKERGQFEKTN
jgi:acyl-CoA thioester hydrolase